MKRFVFGLASGIAIFAGGLVVSKIAEKNPKMKVVKDKIVKTGKDFADDIKDVGKSVADSFKKEQKGNVAAQPQQQ